MGHFGVSEREQVPRSSRSPGALKALCQTALHMTATRAGEPEKPATVSRPTYPLLRERLVSQAARHEAASA